MGRLSGRWVGVGIAILVVGALALYAGSSASGRPAASGTSDSLFAPADAQAQPVPAIETVPAMSAGEIAGLIVKIGIVAAVLGGSLWLLRRYAGTSTRAAGRTGAIVVADMIVLAQGRALYLVDVGDRALVLGATPQQLSCLAELSDPDVLEKLRTLPERPAPPFAALSERLAAAMAPRRVEAGAPAVAASPRVPVEHDDETRFIRPPRPAAAAPTFAEALSAQGVSTHRGVDDDAPTVSTGERRAAMMARIKAMRDPATP